MSRLWSCFKSSPNQKKTSPLWTRKVEKEFYLLKLIEEINWEQTIEDGSWILNLLLTRDFKHSLTEPKEQAGAESLAVCGVNVQIKWNQIIGYWSTTLTNKQTKVLGCQLDHCSDVVEKIVLVGNHW